jgi:hypothetical protein
VYYRARIMEPVSLELELAALELEGLLKKLQRPF